MPFFRPLRSMRRAIDSSERLIEFSLAVIEASASLATRHPLCNARRLHRASRCLIEAADQIIRATYAMQDADACIALVPEEEAAGAPERLLDDTMRLLEAAGNLNLVTDQLSAAVAAAVLLERSGQIEDSRPLIIALPLLNGPIENASCVLGLRCDGSAHATSEEGAKKRCRGRAPPAVSTGPR